MEKCRPKLTFREMISRADNELYAKKRSRSPFDNKAAAA